MRVAAAYHFALGLVFAVFPSDTLHSLALDPPRYWGLWYGACSMPLLIGAMLTLALRRPALRPGMVMSVVLWNLTVLTLGVFFVIWTDLPRVLLGPAVAAGLWAWLLWGLYSPES